jgi:hypothetical protein
MEGMATSRLSTEQLRRIAEDGYAVAAPYLDVKTICELSSVLDTSHAGERNLRLTLHVRGADKLWAFKSTLEIASCTSRVSGPPETARGWYHGIRMPGTSVPGIITPGTFYRNGSGYSGTCITRRRLSSLTCMTSDTKN